MTLGMSTATGQPSSSQPQDAHVLEPDLSSTSPGASTSVLPLAGPSSLNTVLPSADRISGNKRKQDEDDEDDPPNNEDKSHDRKKPKHETEDLDGGTSSFTVQDAASLITELRSPSLEDQSTLSIPDPSASSPPPPDVPTSTINLPPPLTPPPRPHTAPPPSPIIVNGTPKARHLPPTSNLLPQSEPLHTYSCPICFSSPTNATLTPCGHIMCGECLFTAVEATRAIGFSSRSARCPVCRAEIPRWDGRGGGVIGIQPRVVITI